MKHHCTTKQSQPRERYLCLAFVLSFVFCMKYIVQTMHYSPRNYSNSRVEWSLKRACLVACVAVCPGCVRCLMFALCLILIRDLILLKNACFESLVIHVALDVVVLCFCLCAYLFRICVYHTMSTLNTIKVARCSSPPMFIVGFAHGSKRRIHDVLYVIIGNFSFFHLLCTLFHVQLQ